MAIQFLWTLAATVVAGAMVLILKNPPSPLEWEDGRRKARRPYIKDAAYYAKYGVKSIEEYVRNSRGIKIFTKRWLPIGGVYKGLVVYCHGYGDTCAYFFEDIAIRLAAANYAVAGMDYEGHGQSQGRHVSIRNFDTIIDDVIEFCDTIKGEPSFHGLPSFLYGESMGGAVALKVHFKQPTSWQGAILLAPMCKIAPDMYPHPLIVTILKLLARPFPNWKLVPTSDILEVAFRVPEKQVRAGLNPTSFKSKPRLGTAIELLRVTDEIAAHLIDVSLPLLILHGGKDSVTDPLISKSLFDVCRSSDKTLKLYEDSWHALTAGEPDEVVDQVVSDIFDWLDRRSLHIGPPSIDLWNSAVKELTVDAPLLDSVNGASSGSSSSFSVVS